MKVGDGGALVLLVGAAALAWIVKDHTSTPYDELFDTTGAKYGVPPNLLRAIGRVESGFNPGALNPANGDYGNGTRDIGLMQINTSNGTRFGLSRADLLDPTKSVDAAARILVELRHTLGDRFSSFTWPAAYNVGPDLQPQDVGAAYASRVLYHWELYDFGRILS